MNNKQLMNQIVELINTAAKNNGELHLTAEQVKVLSDEIGHIRYVPVLTMEQVGQLVKDGKLGQPVGGKD